MKTTSRLSVAVASVAAMVGASLWTAAPAFAASSGQQTASGTVPSVLSVTVADSTVTFGSLTPLSSPVAESAGTVTVQANEPYSLVVSDTGGMESTTATGKFLADNLEVSDSVAASPASSAGATASLASPTAIDATEGTAGTGQTLATDSAPTTSDTYDVTLTQRVTDADAPGTYSDTLTYTVSAAA